PARRRAGTTTRSTGPGSAAGPSAARPTSVANFPENARSFIGDGLLLPRLHLPPMAAAVINLRRRPSLALPPPEKRRDPSRQTRPARETRPFASDELDNVPNLEAAEQLRRALQ